MANEDPALTAPNAASCDDPENTDPETQDPETKDPETKDPEDNAASDEVKALKAQVAALTKQLADAQAKLDAQAKFRAVTASAAQTAAQASKDWPELVKELGFKAAAEKFPEIRKSYMRTQAAKGDIRLAVR